MGTKTDRGKWKGPDKPGLGQTNRKTDRKRKSDTDKGTEAGTTDR